jgi:hypothetical protein
MADRCSRCQEKFPSSYYFVPGVTPLLCINCAATLSPPERDRLIADSARAAGAVVRSCLRCERTMMRGELAYEDAGGHADATRVRDIRWVVARQESSFLGLLTEWVIDRALPLYVWRCGGCGYAELATEPDPASVAPRPQRTDDDALL